MPPAPVVILTQEAPDNAQLAELLAQFAVATLDYPCIATRLRAYAGEPLPDGRTLEDFRLLVFTSRRAAAGLAAVRERLRLLRPLVACVGESTAQAVADNLGLACDILPAEPTAGGLARAIVEQCEMPRPALHFRGSKTSGALLAILEQHGWDLAELIVYDSYTPELQPLELPGPLVAVFASPSAAQCFFETNRHLLSTAECVAIGPTTAARLEQLGVTRLRRAPEPNHAALMATIVQAMQRAVQQA